MTVKKTKIGSPKEMEELMISIRLTDEDIKNYGHLARWDNMPCVVVYFDPEADDEVGDILATVSHEDLLDQDIFKKVHAILEWIAQPAFDAGIPPEQYVNFDRAVRKLMKYTAQLGEYAGVVDRHRASSEFLRDRMRGRIKIQTINDGGNATLAAASADAGTEEYDERLAAAKEAYHSINNLFRSCKSAQATVSTILAGARAEYERIQYSNRENKSRQTKINEQKKRERNQA